jgi:hypothetical protein
MASKLATDIVFGSLILILLMLAVLFVRVESKHEPFSDRIRQTSKSGCIETRVLT